jgi:hypothetical protein
LPKAAEHRAKLLFVAREMENRITNHDVGEPGREGHRFNEANSEILRGQTGAERCRELAHVLNSLGVRVDCKHFATFTEQVNEVPAISATGVEHTHASIDISAEDLIEDVNIDLAELFLNIQRGVSTIGYSTVTDLARLRGWSTSQPRRTAM